MDKLSLKQAFNDAVTRLDGLKVMYDSEKAAGAPRSGCRNWPRR